MTWHGSWEVISNGSIHMTVDKAYNSINGRWVDGIEITVENNGRECRTWILPQVASGVACALENMCDIEVYPNEETCPYDLCKPVSFKFENVNVLCVDIDYLIARTLCIRDVWDFVSNMKEMVAEISKKEVE